MTFDNLPPADRARAEALHSGGRLDRAALEAALSGAVAADLAASGGLLGWLIARGILRPTNGGDAPTVQGAPVAGDPTRAGSAPEARLPARIGRLEVLGLLGKGGMGVVYRAYDPHLRRTVAVKVLSAADRVDEEKIARFLREARTAGSLRHPGIVAVHEVGMFEDAPYVVMDVIEGTSLDVKLAEGPAWPREERIRVLRDTARAVQHAHAHGVIHRDLKPSNVRLDAQGRACVLDFGLARRLDDGARLTASGQLLGTLGYMPPEQIDGLRGRIGPPSDVFALGAMLYEALTGRPPFLGGHPMEIAAHTIRGDVARPRALDPGVPIDLETVCLRCLDSEPARRYADAGALADELDRILAGEPILARPVSGITRFVRRARRHRTALAASACAAALLLVASWYAWNAHLRATEARQRRERDACVARTLERWAELGEVLSALDAAHARQGAAEPVRAGAARAAALAFLAAAPADPASQSVARALVAWARFRCGEAEEGRRALAEARALDPELPYAGLIEGWLDLSDRLAEDPLPVVLPSADGPRLAPVTAVATEAVAAARRADARLDEALRAGAWGDGTAQDWFRMATAVRRLTGGDPGGASGLLAGLEGVPSLRFLRVDLLAARARAHYLGGNFAQAAADFAAASNLRRGDAALAVAAGWALVARGQEQVIEASRGLPAWVEALEKFGRALALLPERAEPLAGRALTRWLIGQEMAGEGRDGRTALQNAIADAEAALRLDPDSFDARLARGGARGALSDFAPAEPAVELLRGALSDLDAALDRAPERVDARMARAMARTRLGRRQDRSADGNGSPLRAALDDYALVVQATPRTPGVWILRSRTWLLLSDEEEAAGRDPRPCHLRAIEDADRALTLGPGIGGAFEARGKARLHLGRVDAAHGGDPRERFRTAIADFEAWLGDQSLNTDALRSQALAWIWLAQAEGKRGGDAPAAVERALAAATRAREIDPRQAWAYLLPAEELVRMGRVAEALDLARAGLTFVRDDAALRTFVREREGK